MTAARQTSTLPLAVHLGFAGSRRLFDPQAAPADESAFHEAVRRHLIERIEALRGELGLTSQHFLCGVSQVAVGADFLFTEACREKNIPQRVFLSQSREDYLGARGSAGPDFTESEQATARELLASSHVIEERVLSQAADRHSRFEEVNLEIARVSAVVLCLVRADAEARSGGTVHLRDAATRRGKPVLEIRVAVVNGEPLFSEEWYGPELSRFVAPELPPDIAAAEAPPELRVRQVSGVPMAALPYLGALKAAGSGQAKTFQGVFKMMALLIISAHVLATTCAVVALSVHHHEPLAWLLGLELVLLAAGFTVHVLLHHFRAVRVWAMSRLVAEVARSVKSLQQLHVPLDFLFTLPFPALMQPLFRTIEVLHLASTKGNGTPLREKSKSYAAERLDGVNGQLAYYTESLARAESRRRWASRGFYYFTATAFLATLLKLGMLHPRLALDATDESFWAAWFGSFAILMPVLAVSALSLVASFDLEARIHTYQDTLDYLTRTRPLFDDVRSEHELIRLVSETEAQLLGENANWTSRRSFTSVT